MAVTATPIFVQTPLVGIGTITSLTAVTTRTNIAGTTNLVQVTPTSTNGKRIDRVVITSKETTVAGIVHLWIYNGTTSFLFDEILVTAVTGSTTVAGFSTYKDYTALNLPPTYQLYAGVTVDQDFNVFAFGGDY